MKKIMILTNNIFLRRPKLHIWNLLTVCLFLFNICQAEEFNMNNMPPPDMSMNYSAGKLQKGSSVTVWITIPDNWHVNANIAADEFLKPSSIEIAALGVHFGEPKWPEPIKEYSEALDLENLVFKGEFKVVLPVDSVDTDYDTLTTNVTFHYQACDNSICLAPAKKTIKLGELGLNSRQGSSLKKNENEIGTAAQDGTPAGILALLLFAFIGGIILNLMPCVLPVLSLKLFSLIKQAGESRGRLLALGGATTAGILASFWVLAAVVAAVKAGGGSAGWGMQFQSAGFIAFMTVILTAFAMSFFGVFEIWLPWNATTKMDAAGHKHGLAGAFFTGALLVLLSTPCSAPFLGTAMGFAFAQSTPVLFLFFTAAGLGLSLPYILVSAFPKVLKVFPKPGAWMVRLQKIMGVLLLASVAWLFWIVNEQAGLSGVGIFAIIAVVSIACSVLLGKFAPPGTAFTREVAGIALAVIALFSIWFGIVAPEYERAASDKFNARLQEQMTEDGWFRYTPELIEEFAKAKRTVFIDVTADWCLTCKANEAAVLSGESFRRAMDSLNVALVKADWTRETPEVNALLQSMQKSGVPAYAIYPEGDVTRQIVLPELLTAAGIVELVNRD